jgi:hypothetical protein
MPSSLPAAVVALIIGLSSLPAVAARGDPPPASGDPFQDLIDLSKVQAARDEAFRNIAGKKVGVILTKNADAQLRWLKDSLTPTGIDALAVGQLGLAPSIEKLARQFIDPADLTSAVLNPFRARAEQVKVFKDLFEFRDSGFDIAAVVDLNYTKNVSGLFTRDFEYGLKVDAHLFDRQLRRGPTITGEHVEKTTVEGLANWDYLFRSKSVALGNFEKAADRTLGPVSAAAPAATTLVVPKTDTASRLRQLDDLLRRGSISEQEAQEQRKRILGEI